MCYAVKEDQSASHKRGGQIKKPGRKNLQGFGIFLLKSMQYCSQNNAPKSIIFPCDDPYFEKKLVCGLFGVDPWNNLSTFGG